MDARIKRIFFLLSFLFLSSCLYKQERDAAITVLSEMAYEDVHVYDLINESSFNSDGVTTSRRGLAKNIVIFAVFLKASRLDLEDLPVQGKVALCYLSGNYSDIFSEISTDWEGNPVSREYFGEVKKFLDENSDKIMSYTAFAKYAEDKTDCYLKKTQE